MQADCSAHTPLRTVRESFPSYGSSPHKAGAVTLLAYPPPHHQQAHELMTWRYLYTAVSRCALGSGSVRTHQLTGVSCHLLSRIVHSSIYVLAISDPANVGISRALHSGISFFGHPTAAAPDPPCGEVCPAVNRSEAGSFSMFRSAHRMI